jgi:hypothetical protein
MSKLVLLVPLLACASASASAQSAFSGFYASADVVMELFIPRADNVTLTVKNGPYAGTYARTAIYPRTFDVSGTWAVGSMSAITDKFLLGIGLEQEPIASSPHKVKIISSTGNVSYSTYAQTSHFNVFLSPAYALKKDKLVFGKIGYTNSTEEIDFDADETPDHIAEGVVLGAGYKQIVSGGVFLFGEANYYHYPSKNYTTSGITRDGLIFVSDQKITSKGFSTSVGFGYVLPRSLTRK